MTQREDIVLGMDPSDLVNAGFRVEGTLEGIAKKTLLVKQKFSEIIGPYTEFILKMREQTVAGEKVATTATAMSVAAEKATLHQKQFAQQIEQTAIKAAMAAEAQGKHAKAATILEKATARVSASEVQLQSALTKSTEGFRLQSQTIDSDTERLTKNLLAVKQQIAERRRMATLLRQSRQVSGFATSIQRGTDTSVGNVAEVLAYKNAVGRLAETMKSSLASGNAKLSQMKKIWADLADGKIRAYQGTLRQIQNQMMGVRTAAGNLGNAQRKAMEDAARAAERAARSTDKLGDSTKKAGEAGKYLQLTWRSIIRLLSVQIVYRSVFALTSALREAAETAIDLSIRIAEIQTIDTGMGAFEDWSDVLRKLADSWNITLVDQAEAAYQALSNQVVNSAAEFAVFGEEVNRLATATVSSAEDATNVLTAVLNSYHMDVSRAREVSAMLFKTVELGRVRLSEMGESLGLVSIMAAQLEIPLEELLSTITTLTIQGVKYNQSATQLRGIFVKLLKPTEEMAEFFKDIGVESGEAAIRTYGLAGVLRLLIERTGGSSTELAQYVNRIRGLSGAMALTNEGYSIFISNIAEIKNSMAAYDRAVNVVLGNTGKQLRINLEQIQNFLVQDIMGEFINDIAGVTGNFSLFTTAVKSLVLVIKRLLLPAIGTVIIAFATLQKAAIKAMAIAAFTNPLSAVMLVFMAHGIWLEYYTTRYKKFWASMESGARAYRNLLEREALQQDRVLQQMIEGTMSGIGKSATDLRQDAAALVATLNTEVTESISLFEDWQTFFGKVQETVSADAEEMARSLADSLKKIEADFEANQKRLHELTTVREVGLLGFDLDDIGYETDADLKAIEAVEKAEQEQHDQRMKNLDERVDAARQQGYDTDGADKIKEKYTEQLKLSKEAHTQEKRDREALATRQRAAVIEERITLLRARAAELAKTGDQAGVTDTFNEITRLETRRKSILDAYHAENIAAGVQMDFRQRFTDLTDEEVSLREGLTALQHTQYQELSDQQDVYLENLQRMKEIVTELVAFKLKDALALDPEATNAAITAYQGLLQSLQDVRASLGMSENSPTGDLDLAGLYDAVASSGRIEDEREYTNAVREAHEQKIKALEAELMLLKEVSKNTIDARDTELEMIALAQRWLGVALKDFDSGLNDSLLAENLKRSTSSGPRGGPQDVDAINDIKEKMTTVKEQLTSLTNGETVDLGAIKTLLGELASIAEQERIRQERYRAERQNAPTQWASDTLTSGPEAREMLTQFSEALMNTAFMLQDMEMGRAEAPGVLDATVEMVAAEMERYEARYASTILVTETANAEKIQTSSELFYTSADRTRDAAWNFENAAAELKETVRQGNRYRDVKPVGFATGGVAGLDFNKPRGTDTIPAMLSPGERVLTVDENKIYTQNLQTRRLGVEPRYYSNGGNVEVGGINVQVTESADPQQTAAIVVEKINNGLRRNLIHLRR